MGHRKLKKGRVRIRINFIEGSVLRGIVSTWRAVKIIKALNKRSMI